MDNLRYLLLIEDDAVFAHAITALLKRRFPKIEITHAVNVRDATAHLNKDRFAQSRFDVILVDLNLPDCKGINTVITVRQSCSGTPIIILTGADDESLAMQALKEGAQDYLVKGDIDGKGLARSIQYAIEREKISAEREDFVATLTHDLKGPLQGANRILEMLVKGEIGPISADQCDLLCRLLASNSTLLEMVSNLLEVYRYDKDINTIGFTHTNLVKLVNATMDEVLFFAQDRSIEIRQEIAQDKEIAIMADPQSIRRVLRNLLDNAIKFTPQGGVVTVKVCKNNEKVLLAVQDTGPGITDDDRRFLFERFYRGTSGRGYSRSTGLGLYLCRQIVQHHKGTITCLKSEEQGSMFLLEFPGV